VFFRSGLESRQQCSRAPAAEDLWRIDFRLPDGETEEQALEPALLRRRINAVLSMINQAVEWRLDWATVYSANTLTLDKFVQRTRAIGGDAAHLLPIFGVRASIPAFRRATIWPGSWPT